MKDPAFNVPDNWEPVYNRQRVTPDFPGDPDMFSILLGWLVRRPDLNGSEFISIDKCPPEFRNDPPPEPPLSRSEKHAAIVKKVHEVVDNHKAARIRHMESVFKEIIELPGWQLAEARELARKGLKWPIS